MQFGGFAFVNLAVVSYAHFHALPINWSHVATDPAARSYKDNVDIGPCICDLTWNHCDYNCHCDPDCSAQEKSSLFTGSRPEGPQLRITHCSDPDLIATNQRGGLSASFVDNLLCVETDNNPTKGSFFEVPPAEVNDTLFQQNKNLDRFNFQPYVPNPPIYRTSASDVNSTAYFSGFKVGDQMKMATLDPRSGWQSTVQGYFPIPAPFIVGNECGGSNYALFKIPSTSTCSQKIANLQSACNSQSPLSARYWTRERMVAKYQSASLARAEDWVDVKIIEFKQQNLRLDNLSDADFPDFSNEIQQVNRTIVPTNRPAFPPGENQTWSPTVIPPTAIRVFTALPTQRPTLSPTERPTSSPTDPQSSLAPTLLVKPTLAPRRGFTPVNPPEPFWNATSCSCQNAVLGVKYTFYHEWVGTIYAATANFTLGSVQTSGGQCGGETYVEQNYDTLYSLAERDTIGRPKSGNPGYQHGLPLKAGYPAYRRNDTDLRKAVSELERGLELLPAGSDGSCLEPEFIHSGTQVLFGEDMLKTCDLSFNYVSLKTFCLEESKKQSIIVRRLNITASLFAKWGDSNPLNLEDWTQIDYEPITPSANWVEARSVCDDVITNVNIEILTAKRGAELNPQSTILAARVSFGTGSFAWTSLDRVSPQRFPISTTVTFIPYQFDSLEEFIPGTPPIYPFLPADVLYPLYIEKNAVAAVAGSMPLVVLTSCMLVSYLM
mmetsp:Transcript_22034/g.43794  ORF Transcript_22034/g.43794 Transcript_22034/m.43794 type:complete len:719 (+) Transcript_22034:24-2180(+)